MIFLFYLFTTVVNNYCICDDTYEVQVPGSDPIRIADSDIVWDNVATTNKPRNRGFFTTSKATTNINSPIGSDDDSDFNEDLSNSALKDFLENYAEKLRKDKPVSYEEPLNSTDDDKDKLKKSWDLMNLRKHNHPNDDSKGWVSLEPIPWSVSKISKWQSKPKPAEKPWNKYHSNVRPWMDYEESQDSSNDYPYSTSRPLIDKKKYQVYYVNEPKPNVKPVFPKPSSIYIQASPSYQVPHGYYKHNHRNCDHDEDDEIITDGLPPNFPGKNVDTNRRQDNDMPTNRHPFMGDGEWVLLSTTRGYKSPRNKQRSLELNPEAVGTHRSVRLTVLPPLEGSKVNMTTSHGGLLQVESTFESVEQAQKKFLKQQKKKKNANKLLKNRRPTAITDSTIATITHHPATDSGAVLAGVGAGMIPATMAMLVPMAMQGKRRKRAIRTTRYPSGVEITLPRYF